MAGLAKFNFKITQLYPGSGVHHLNTCANPDCLNIGAPLTAPSERRTLWATKRPDLSLARLDEIERHGPGAYKFAGADQDHRRVLHVFEYENDHHEWVDQRTTRCLGQTRDGRVCNSGFSFLSEGHLAQEIERLHNHDGVLDGPAPAAAAAPDPSTGPGNSR